MEPAPGFKRREDQRTHETMYNRILVPTDGSEVARSAARAAVALAAQFDADVHTIYVTEEEPYPFGFDDAMAELARYGEEAAQTVTDWAAEAGVDATTSVIDDAESVPRAILSYTAEHDIDLVVMGTHGRSGLDRVLLGSVTELTLRKSPVPVVTVHEETVLDPPFESILVPFDGSAGAEGALDHAIDLAQESDAAIHAINVVDHATMAGGDSSSTVVIDSLRESGERALDAAVERAVTAGVPVADSTVRVGSPFREILDYTGEHEIDCVVMGTRGRSGLDRVLLGSVTERVVRKADIPVIATKSSKGDQ